MLGPSPLGLIPEALIPFPLGLFRVPPRPPFLYRVYTIYRISYISCVVYRGGRQSCCSSTLCSSSSDTCSPPLSPFCIALWRSFRYYSGLVRSEAGGTRSARPCRSHSFLEPPGPIPSICCASVIFGAGFGARLDFSG